MDPINQILSLTDAEFEKVMRRNYFEWGCERRAKQWFGWTHSYLEWTPEEKAQERREARRRKKEERAAGRSKS
ncbi:hypothetical protein ACQKJ1_27970 [Methylorubrum rhodesianum]|uniref:hypothetical protein n=1 Tax=Methylorubrum rhodesianum TaxID=29427 RepID=UPI003D069231